MKGENIMKGYSQQTAFAQRSEGKIRLCKDRLLEKYPLHLAVLNRMHVTCKPAVQTMAVGLHNDGGVYLFHNPEFVLEITMGQLMGVILHEINHVLFRHLLMKQEDYPNQAALIIAQEVTVNEFVKEPLPEGVVLLKDYPLLPPWESTDQRYKRLEKVISTTKVILTLDDHGQWELECDGLSEDEKKEILDQIIQDAIKEAGAGRMGEALQDHGTEPGSDLEGVASGTGKINWQAQLSRYAGQLLETRPVFHRPNRRFPELLGVVPGQSRQSKKPKIMGVLDTSGSITPRLLTQIDGELKNLARHYEVLVVECDCQIQRTYPYKPLKEVWGRGGTDFRPPLEMEFLKKHRPDLVVYFTDGYGPADKLAPKVPVVWCILSGGTEPAPWGHYIFCKE